MSKTPINAILKCKYAGDKEGSIDFLTSLFILGFSGLAVCDFICLLEYVPFTIHMYIVMKGNPLPTKSD